MPQPPPSTPTPAITSYPIKWVFTPSATSLPIVMQSSNGPCALLALANALLQTRACTLQPGLTTIQEPYLMSLLAEYVSAQPTTAESAAAIDDFLDLLPCLNRGMHINVRFHSPAGFEFTRELSVFDVFPMRLLHGWLVDPEDSTLAAAVGSLSYNQLQDELVRTEPLASDPDAGPSAPPLEAFLEPAQPDTESDTTITVRHLRPAVMEFLDNSATQLTIYGLAVLHDTMKEGETGVLFRNSHFYVLRKQGGKLYTLVTDEGYLKKQDKVWEQLMDISGESEFCDALFRTPAEIADAAKKPPGATPVSGAAAAGSSRGNSSGPAASAGASSTMPQQRTASIPGNSRAAQACQTNAGTHPSVARYASRGATVTGGKAKESSCAIQ